MSQQALSTPAIYQSTIQSIQCKLILFRISERRQKNGDEVFDRAFSNLQRLVDRLAEACKQQKQPTLTDRPPLNLAHPDTAMFTTESLTLPFNNEEATIFESTCASSSTTAHQAGDTSDQTTLNATLRRVKAQAALTLVHVVRRQGGDSYAERVIVWQRANSFTKSTSNKAAAFRRAVRVELAHLRIAFDRAIVNVHGRSVPDGLRFVRKAFLAQLLPRFVVGGVGDDEGGDSHSRLIDDDCSICCDVFVKGCLAARFTVCGHPFHAGCVDR